MPVVGFFVGSGVGAVSGRYSDGVAAAVLFAVGAFMLWPRDEDDETDRVLLLRRARGAAILALGLGISLDELAIGFGGGLLRLPILLLAVLIAAQAFIAAQAGMRLGTWLSKDARERAEGIAGLLLIGAAALILAEALV
jgi:putative Mn2+ efflux pump MntP